MNLQDERTKGIIASVVIVLSILFCYFQIKSRLVPADPAAAAAANGTPPPGNATVTAPPAGGPAATAGATAAAPGVTTGTTVAQSPNAVLPNGPFKIVVRDPFVTTPTYEREIAKGGVTGVSGMSTPRIQTNIGYKPPQISLTTGATTGQLPAVPSDSMKIFPPLPNMKTEPPTQIRPPANTTSPMASNPTGPVPPITPPKPEATFALTGTVEGDVPMAILRSKDRSYLVREGDWLEGDFQVRRISPKQVVLRDRSGRSRILNLGVVTDAT
jgi:hypothetical protein